MLILNLNAQVDIPSVNSMFRPRVGYRKTGERYSTLYKDDKVSNFQTTLNWMFCTQIKRRELPPKESLSRIFSYYTFGFKQDRYWKRDVSNCIKIVEDALMGMDDALLPYDDSMVTASLERKVIAEKSFIRVKLVLVSKTEDIDDLKILNQIF